MTSRQDALMPKTATSLPHEGQTLNGTIWACRCGRQYKEPVVGVSHVNDARAQRDAMAQLIREVSDEVVLLPVATLNAIAERAERAEAQVRELQGIRDV